MGMIVPTRGRRPRGVAARESFADQKRWISNEFYQALNRHMELDDGSQVTYAQQMVMSVVDMATNPEKDDYVRLAAAKFITEHLEGKAAVMKDESHEEMPRLAIVIGDADAGRIARAVAEANPDAEPEDGILAEISDGDGGGREEVIL